MAPFCVPVSPHVQGDMVGPALGVLPPPPPPLPPLPPLLPPPHAHIKALDRRIAVNTVLSARIAKLRFRERARNLSRCPLFNCPDIRGVNNGAAGLSGCLNGPSVRELEQ